jgi:hypothetical protein
MESKKNWEKGISPTKQYKYRIMFHEKFGQEFEIHEMKRGTQTFTGNFFPIFLLLDF